MVRLRVRSGLRTNGSVRRAEFPPKSSQPEGLSALGWDRSTAQTRPPFIRQVAENPNHGTAGRNDPRCRGSRPSGRASGARCSSPTTPATRKPATYGMEHRQVPRPDRLPRRHGGRGGRAEPGAEAGAAGSGPRRGHNARGTSTCDGGLIIDTSPMKGIHVDPERRRVRAEAGAKWGELRPPRDAVHRFGLATARGTVPDTGVAGLTLGDGFGWLSPGSTPRSATCSRSTSSPPSTTPKSKERDHG